MQTEARFHSVRGEPELVQVSIVDTATEPVALAHSVRVGRAEADQIKARALLTGTPVKEYRVECKAEDVSWAKRVVQARRAPTRVIRRRRNPDGGAIVRG